MKKPIILLFIISSLLVISPVQAQTEATLTWSTDTYTPLDYPGKALPSRGSIVEVVANINTINPEQLNYKWFLNNHIQKESSGQGKQTFEFNVGENIYQNHLIKVEITDSQGNLLASSDYLSLGLHNPEIILESNQTEFSSNQEAEFTARPYFFNINSLKDLSYQWSFGNESASQEEEENPNVFVLKIGELVESFSRNLNIWAENKNNLLQRAQTSVEVSLNP